MPNKEQSISAESNLEQLSTQLGLTGAKFIKIYFKPGKVTASCRKFKRTFGSSGSTINETISNLTAKINTYGKA